MRSKYWLKWVAVNSGKQTVAVASTGLRKFSSRIPPPLSSTRHTAFLLMDLATRFISSL